MELEPFLDPTSLPATTVEFNQSWPYFETSFLLADRLFGNVHVLVVCFPRTGYEYEIQIPPIKTDYLSNEFLKKRGFHPAKKDIIGKVTNAVWNNMCFHSSARGPCVCSLIPPLPPTMQVLLETRNSIFRLKESGESRWLKPIRCSLCKRKCWV